MAPLDPTDPQTINRYAHVRTSPVNLTDPSVLCWLGMCEAAAAFISNVGQATGSGILAAVQASVSVVQSGVQAVANLLSGFSPLTENSINSCSLTNNIGDGIVSQDGASVIAMGGGNEPLPNQSTDSFPDPANHRD